MNSSQISPPTKPIGDRYLSFYLNRQTPALLLMDYAQEVILVPTSRLSPMPNMPECVLGLLNRRSRVLWVVNLAQLLGLPASESSDRQYQIIITQVKQVKLALAVQSVEGVKYYSHQNSQAPTEIFARLAPYLSGCITQGKETLIVLDAEKIASSPNLQP